MNDLNNRHRLAGDFNMYYSSTFAFFRVDGEPRVVYVDDTESIGDDRQFDGFRLLGNVFRPDGGQYYGGVVYSEVEGVRPPSGYYDVFGSGERDTYVSFLVNNRTQRKGVDPRNVLINHGQQAVTGQMMIRIFLQAEEMISDPAHRDFFIKDGVVNWKGVKVGQMVDNRLSVDEQFKNQEDLLCRLLAHR
uniref:Virion structural protein n=1 Tax=Pseudomonas phage KV2023 TaxID=3234047 RepID=A0AB39C6W6_9CAUD